MRTAVVIVSSALAATSLHAATVAHWNFNDGSGATLTDSSGSGNNGTLTNFDTTANAGDSGTSGWTSDGLLEFDGTNDYVTTTVSTTAISGSFTLEAVVQYAGASNRTWTPIFASSMNPFNAAQILFIGKTQGNSNLTLNIKNNSESIATTLFNGSRHHLAVVYDAAAATESLRIYVDGSQIYSDNDRTPFTGVTNNLWIGGSGHATGERWLGTMDEVRISDSALAPSAFIPEPSAALLLSLGSLPAFRRRR